jgi:hypothetical protein
MPLRTPKNVWRELGTDTGELASFLVSRNEPLAGRQTARRKRCPSGKQRLHLRDFRSLRLDDVTAQRHDFGVGQRRLLAHQDRARMMRDHRAQELAIADPRLGPHARVAQREYDHRGDTDRHVPRL